MIAATAVAEEIVSPISIDEERVGNDAVDILGQLKSPLSAAGKLACSPEHELAGAGNVKQIVIARETNLAGGGDGNGIAAFDPQDIISQRGVLATFDPDRIA